MFFRYYNQFGWIDVLQIQMFFRYYNHFGWMEVLQIQMALNICSWYHIINGW